MQINHINQTQNQNFGIELSGKLVKTLDTLRQRTITAGNKGAKDLFNARMHKLKQVCPDMSLENWDNYIVAVDNERHHAQIVLTKPLEEFPVRLKQLLQKLSKIEKHMIEKR